MRWLNIFECSRIICLLADNLTSTKYHEIANYTIFFGWNELHLYNPGIGVTNTTLNSNNASFQRTEM